MFENKIITIRGLGNKRAVMNDAAYRYHQVPAAVRVCTVVMDIYVLLVIYTHTSLRMRGTRNI